MHFDVPPPRPERPRRELGFNLHLDVALFGASAAPEAGMQGMGVAFRFRPLPPFAVDVGGDVLGGRDHAGNRRAEQALVGNVLVFFNPRDRLQVYALGGFSLSQAFVRVERLGGETVAPYDTTYTHHGHQAGLGLEWRLSRRAALGTDLLLFLRNRTDDGRSSDPEYVDPSTHLATNTSYGAFFRAGVTFYF
jgi:hypothetical protein